MKPPDDPEERAEWEARRPRRCHLCWNLVKCCSCPRGGSRPAPPGSPFVEATCTEGATVRVVSDSQLGTLAEVTTEDGRRFYGVD